MSAPCTPHRLANGFIARRTIAGWCFVCRCCCAVLDCVCARSCDDDEDDDGRVLCACGLSMWCWMCVVCLCGDERGVWRRDEIARVGGRACG